MPADINKTIEIAYKANVQNLLTAMSKTGKVSEKTAREIAESLDKAYTKATRDAEKAAKKQERSMKDVGNASKSLGKTIGKSFAGIAAAIGAASIAALAFGQHVADMSNQLVDASAKTGVNVDTLNGLRLAAEGAGLSFEDLETGLIRLPQMMNEAAEGSKKAQEAFDKLGVQTTETVDGFQQLRSADDVLKDVFHSLQAVESAEQKAALAAEVFGRNAGPKFVQSGAIDNLENFVALAEEFGVSTGPDMQSQMADFQRVTATAMNVATGELLRFLDVLAGKEAGAGGGLTDIILGTTEAIIYFGSVSSSVFSGFSKGFGVILSGLNVALQSIAGSTSDLERAQIVLNETMAEADVAADAFFSPVQEAEARLESFRSKFQATMKATGDGGQPRGGTSRGGTGAVTPAGKAVDELEASSKILEDINKEFDKHFEDQFQKNIQQLSGLELIEAQHNRTLAVLRKQKMETEDTINKEIDRLLGLEQTNEVAERISELTLAREEHAQLIREQMQDENEKFLNAQFEHEISNIDGIMEAEDIAHEKRMENTEEERKAKERLYREIRAGMDMTIDGINVAADLVDAFGIKNKKNAELAFNIRKAAALAQIVVETATNVVESFPNPFLMAGATALGVAQGAVVAAEQPSFHMGGMIEGRGTLAPDETMVRAKQGEAILSTNAVRNLRGAQGVQALERGQWAQPTIVVVNPFKHYDRFIRGRDAMGMGIASTGRKGY